jgi:membrane protein implicated in regulation of membrane protease activity
MLNFIRGFNGIDLVFLLCAVVGFVVLTIRMVLMVFGFGDHDGDVGHGDVGHDGHIGGDADATFNLLSIHGLTAFFLMFGLVGLALHREARTSGAVAALGGGVAGTMMMFVVAYLTSWMLKLQSSGNEDINNAVGEEGTVYLTIPSDGSGQAQVAIQNRLRVVNAVSRDKQLIPTGERVKVVEVVGGNTLVVEKIR